MKQKIASRHKLKLLSVVPKAMNERSCVVTPRHLFEDRPAAVPTFYNSTKPVHAAITLKTIAPNLV